MTEEEIKKIESRCNKATSGIWKSMVEGRDHTSGDSFIMTEKDDLYIHPFSQNNQDFIANAKQDIPKLIAEIRKLKIEIKKASR